jgi:hypothetical protein
VAAEDERSGAVVGGVGIGLKGTLDVGDLLVTTGTEGRVRDVGGVGN